MKPWILIFFASLLEVCWAISLKNIDKGKIVAACKTLNFFSAQGAEAFLPLLGYIGFGLVNVYLISLAFKEIPISIAFGAWTGLALIFNILYDVFFLKVSFTFLHFIYMAMILGGIVGLKSITAK
jgi:quaternary ammonium compound-resistance protein SugE